ncbi:MAG: hypothetical protein AAB725_01510, partial [Patescibacteria group bacterium]
MREENNGERDHAPIGEIAPEGTADRLEVKAKVIEEALQARQEALDRDENPETAKAKAVAKITEMLSGEYDDLIIPATEELLEKMKKIETAPPDNLPVTDLKQTVAKADATKEKKGPSSRKFTAEEKGRLVEESIKAYEEALTAGKSPRAAEEESQKKFNELVSSGEIPPGLGIVETQNSLKEKISQLEQESRRGPSFDEKLTRELEQRLEEEEKPLSQAEIDDLLGKAEPAEPIKPPEPIQEPKPLTAEEKIAAENIEAARSAQEIEIPKEITSEPVPPAAPVETEPTQPPNPEPTPATPEITPDEKEALEAVSKVEKIEDLEKLPEATKEKLGLGFGNLGFFVKEKVNGWLADRAGWLESKFQNNGAARVVFEAIRESYYRDSAEAKKRLTEISEGGAKKIISQSAYLVGGVLRFGRIAGDIFGYTTAMPLRFVTMTAQIASRGVGFLQEARLKSDEVLKKTGRRVEDAEEAAEEAWKL